MNWQRILVPVGAAAFLYAVALAFGAVENARVTRDRAAAALGRLEDFRCAYGFIEQRDDGIALDPECAKVLGIEPGQSVTHVGRW